jgi:hypothetical protein
LASKLAVTVSDDLTSKLAATISSSLASKHAVTVFRFGYQNRQLRFDDLYIKITAMVSWFVPQNQTGFGLSVTP